MKIHKVKLIKRLILIALIIGATGIYFANRFIKTKGFSNLIEFNSNYWENKSRFDGTQVKEVELVLKDKDFNFLKDKRDVDLARGIQRNDGDNYVKCKIVYQGDTTKAEIRLKGHMTDHLQGDKWSFRVKTKNEKEFMGMYRFSLQKPGTRNYAYEWIYHQLLKNEGIIHLKYDFIRIKLNGKNLGIYAIEEHFGQHIIDDNNRPPGAILRWNPELYWEGRIDEFKKTYLDEDYSAYESSFAEPYDRGVVKKDSVLLNTYLKAASMLEGFRRGDFKVAEVFDIEKLARFHAVIDLVGGYHSLDWSDIKFYYNSDSKLVEPVGYESFSIRKTEKIAGQRVPETFDKIGLDYHDMIFSDPEFFVAYIKNLERICDEKYVHDFLSSIETELNKKWGVLAEDYAYIKVSYQGYFDNIELIRHNLNLPKPLHAFLEEENDTSVRISVTPVSDFPILITGILIDEKNDYPLEQPHWLGPKTRGTFAHYEDIVFKHEDNKIKSIKIRAKIPGSSTEFLIEVAEYPSYKSLSEDIGQQDTASRTTANLDQLEWMNDSVCFFKNKRTVVQNLISIPQHTQLIVYAGQELNLVGEGVLNIAGELACFGQEVNHIFVRTEGLKSGINLLEGSRITANFVQFEGESENVFTFSNAEGDFENCSFLDIQHNFLLASLSKINFSNCASGSVNSFANIDRCLMNIDNFSGQNGETFIKDCGSDITVSYANLSNYTTIFELDHLANTLCRHVIFENNDLVASLNNSAIFKTIGGEILSGINGFEVNNKSSLSQGASYNLYKTLHDNLKHLNKPKSSEV
jgi:hypothetical protein